MPSCRRRVAFLLDKYSSLKRFKVILPRNFNRGVVSSGRHQQRFAAIPFEFRGFESDVMMTY